MIVALQVLRAAAAMMVALSHLPWAEYRDAGHPWFPPLSIGFAGVDVFFVLSGAVMMISSSHLRGFRSAGSFWLRRAIRILPPYWLVTGVALIQFGADYTGGHWGPREWRVVSHSLALLPVVVGPDRDDFYPLVPQGWTLEYEAFFYLLFGLAVAFAPRHKLLSLTAAIVVLCAAGASTDLPDPAYYYGKSITLEFAFGLAVGAGYLGGWRVGPGAAVAIATAALAGFAGFEALGEPDSWRGLGWGLPATGLLAAALCGPRWPSGGLMRPLIALGDASFSLYLMHSFVYQVWYFVLTDQRHEMAISARWFAPMLVSAAVVALATYSQVERPIVRWLQIVLLGRSRRAPFRLPGS